MSTKQDNSMFVRHVKSVLLTCLQAVWNSKISSYPMIEESDGTTKALPPDEVIRLINNELNGLSNIDGDVDRVLSLARSSLDEQIQQTNHQDDKIAKLLTIVAFLTAAAGAYFTKYIEMYPLHNFAYTETLGLWNWLLYATYSTFGLFTLVVSMGALVSFYAIRTRFFSDTPGELIAKREKPYSRLFFREIASTTPTGWAKSFVKYVRLAEPAGSKEELPGSAPASPDSKPAPRESLPDGGIGLDYFRDYVLESYLVAVKVAAKVRLVEHAQALLSLSIVFLIAWLIMISVSFLFVSPITANAAVATPRAPQAAPVSAGSNDSAVRNAPNSNSIVVNCAQASPAPSSPSIRTNISNAKQNTSVANSTSITNVTDAKTNNCPN
jgi:hypothetical protein